MQHRPRSVAQALLLALGLVSAGCGEPPAAVGQRRSAAGPGAASWRGIRAAGMDVRLYVPSGPAPAGGRGLMLVLHGCTQRARDIGDGGAWGATADREQWVVAAPDVPGGGVIAGCWDYYGANHTRSNRHNRFLLELVRDLSARAALAIDPARVYVSGLSSGSGQAMVLGCLAPEVFAGVGLNAGPTLGTGSNQISRVATTRASAASLCRRLAGNRAGALATQLASLVYGDNDFIVATGYNRLSAEVLAEVYGATSGPASFSTAGLPGARPAGRGWRWSDGAGPRVELIENQGLGHNWPSGDGQRGSFVNGSSIDYPEALARFFRDNARRGAPSPPPPPADAGVAPPDAGGAAPDAGTSPPDAGAIDAGQPRADATLTGHIAAGRLSWADFGAYYVENGNASFTLYQRADGTWSTNPPGGGPADAGLAPDAGLPRDAGAPIDAGSIVDAGGFTCQSFEDSNYAHVTAGRAQVCSGGFACAVGSGERMGLFNTFYRSTLAELRAGYFVVGDCP